MLVLEISPLQQVSARVVPAAGPAIANSLTRRTHRDCTGVTAVNSSWISRQSIH